MTEHTLITAVAAGLAMLIGAFGKQVVAALRDWNATRVRLKRESNLARDEEREDTAKHYTAALDVSERARAQVDTWLREEREMRVALHRVVTDLSAQLVILQADLRASQARIRDLEADGRRKDQMIDSLRETLMRDYVRKSIPAGEPDEPIRVALRQVKRDER